MRVYEQLPKLSRRVTKYCRNTIARATAARGCKLKAKLWLDLANGLRAGDMAVNVRHYCLFLTYNALIFSRTDVSNVGSPAVHYQGLFLMETGGTCTKIRLHSLLVER